MRELAAELRALLGWTVLRFTHDDVVRRPGEVAAHLRAALANARTGSVIP